MKPASLALILCIALTLTACGGTRQVSASAPTVTYDHDRGSSAEADVRAREYCLREYGHEVAVLHRGSDRTTYECVPR